MNTYPPGLRRLLRLVRSNPRPPAVGAWEPELPPPGFATGIAARWVARPAPFGADLERFARWAAAAAVCLCLVAAGFRPPPSPADSADTDDFFGVNLDVATPEH